MPSKWSWNAHSIEWHCDGARVSRLILDEYQVAFHLASDCWALTLTLEQVFTWRDEAGQCAIDPQFRSGLSRLLPALGATADSITIDEQGNLALRFQSPYLLHASPGMETEAWNLAGSGDLEGLLYVAAPGGLTRWEPRV